MSEFEEAFDRLRNEIDTSFQWAFVEVSDLELVLNRLDEMIKQQRREALSEMAERDAELILKGY